MSSVVRERNRHILDIPAGYLRLFSLEGGRINNRTAQIVLTSVCVAGIVTTRLAKVYIAPPWMYLDLSPVFLYLPSLVCPWVATIPIMATGVATGGCPILSLFGLTAAVQLVYFGSRFLENRGLGKYRLLAIPFGALTGLFIGAVGFDVLGLMPFKIGLPLMMFRGLISTSICVATVPVIWHFLRKKGLI